MKAQAVCWVAGRSSKSSNPNSAESSCPAVPAGRRTQENSMVFPDLAELMEWFGGHEADLSQQVSIQDGRPVDGWGDPIRLTVENGALR